MNRTVMTNKSWFNVNEDGSLAVSNDFPMSTYELALSGLTEAARQAEAFETLPCVRYIESNEEKKISSLIKLYL